jgi:hypothetical protein
MATYDARPSVYTQIASTADWEKFHTAAGIWDGIDGNSSMVPSFNGRNIEITPGTVIIKGQIWWCDAVVDTAIPAASTQDRVDVLVLRLNRTANSSAGVVAPVIIQGSPGANPVAPPIVQTSTGIWDIPVCQWITRAAGTLTNLSDKRQFSGHTVVAMNSGARPSPPHPRLGLEYDTGYLLRWDGSTWRNIGPKNQISASGGTANDVAYENLITPFAIPGNDSALGPVSYRLQAGGNGAQATGTPRPFNFKVVAFGLDFGPIQDTGNIAAGSHFSWHFTCELIASANGSVNYYGSLIISHAVFNPGTATAVQATQKQYAAGQVNVAAATTIGMQASWTSISGAPSITCISATYDRVAN